MTEQIFAVWHFLAFAGAAMTIMLVIVYMAWREWEARYAAMRESLAEAIKAQLVGPGQEPERYENCPNCDPTGYHSSRWRHMEQRCTECRWSAEGHQAGVEHAQKLGEEIERLNGVIDETRQRAIWLTERGETGRRAIVLGSTVASAAECDGLQAAVHRLKGDLEGQRRAILEGLKESRKFGRPFLFMGDAFHLVDSPMIRDAETKATRLRNELSSTQRRLAKLQARHDELVEASTGLSDKNGMSSWVNLWKLTPDEAANVTRDVVARRGGGLLAVQLALPAEEVERQEVGELVGLVTESAKQRQVIVEALKEIRGGGRIVLPGQETWTACLGCGTCYPTDRPLAFGGCCTRECSIQHAVSKARVRETSITEQIKRSEEGRKECAGCGSLFYYDRRDALASSEFCSLRCEAD
jgi:hypothetical protein